MLIDNFYKINNVIEKETTVFEIELNLKHEIYNGHFPGFPLVPGVCMIQMVKELTEKLVNKILFLSEGTNIKFLTLVNPNAMKILFVEFEQIIKDTGTVKVKAHIKSNELICLKFIGTFVDAIDFPN